MKNKWNEFKNILCLRMDNFGDVLMAQPALRALKQSFPKTKLTLLTSSVGGVIVKYLPEVDKLIAFDAPWVRLENNSNNSETIKKITDKLKKDQFDAAIIFTNYSQSSLPAAMLCYLAKIPQVLAYCRENPYQLINNWVPDKEPFTKPKHGVKRQLDLVNHIGAETSSQSLSVKASQNARKKILEKLKSEKINTKKPWIVLHAGVSEDKRLYPVKLFGKAAKMMVDDMNFQVVVTGSKDEKKLAEGVIKNADKNIYSLAGKLNFEELIGIIDLTPLIISNNTGPVHIASALNTPVVDMYARTNPEHTPWKVKSRVLYFDVPKSVRSSNQTLKYTTPDTPKPMPQPKHIVQAVKELMQNTPEEKSLIPIKIRKW